MKKLTSLIAAALLATGMSCGKDESGAGNSGQDSGFASSEGNQQQDNNSQNIAKEDYGLVALLSTFTNNKGEALFQDKNTGEEVTVSIKDDNGMPLANAQVAFFDGKDFEMFVAHKEGYTPKTEIYPHNSSHQITLTPAAVAPSLAVFKGSQPETDNAKNWLMQRGEYIGCYTKEEIETKNKVYSVFLSVTAGKLPGVDAVTYAINTLNTVVEYIGYAQNIGLVKKFSYDGVHRYFYEPQQSGNKFASFFVDEPFMFGAEQQNGLDDDCDGSVDEYEPCTAEVCDGKDNNCDDVVDEGCGCEPDVYADYCIDEKNSVFCSNTDKVVKHKVCEEGWKCGYIKAYDEYRCFGNAGIGEECPTIWDCDFDIMDACIVVGDLNNPKSTYCTVYCETSKDCPNNYFCEKIETEEKFCSPL